MKFWRVDRKTYHRAKEQRPTPVKIVEATASGNELTLMFDQEVGLLRQHPPKYLTDVAGAEPVNAVLMSPTTLKLTYSEPIDTATQVMIPYRDPSIRTPVGGFVADSSFPVAA